MHWTLTGEGVFCTRLGATKPQDGHVRWFKSSFGFNAMNDFTPDTAQGINNWLYETSQHLASARLFGGPASGWTGVRTEWVSTYLRNLRKTSELTTMVNSLSSVSVKKLMFHKLNRKHFPTPDAQVGHSVKGCSMQLTRVWSQWRWK